MHCEGCLRAVSGCLGLFREWFVCGLWCFRGILGVLEALDIFGCVGGNLEVLQGVLGSFFGVWGIWGHFGYSDVLCFWMFGKFWGRFCGWVWVF